MSTLNLTAENEITISYIQHKHPVRSDSGIRLATSNVTINPLNPGYKQGSSQYEHNVHGHKVSPESATGLCSISIKAPPGKVLSILFLSQTCSRDNQVHVQDSHDGWSTTLDGCSPWKSPGYDVTTASRSAIMMIDLHNRVDFFRLKIHIKAMAVWIQYSLNTRYVSPVLGYIQTPSWHPFTRPVGAPIIGYVTVMVPWNKVTLISVVQIHSQCIEADNPLEIRVFRGQVIQDHMSWNCDSGGSLYARSLTDSTKLCVHVSFIIGGFFGGGRMLFSFHRPLLAPQGRPNGLWNCSVPSWPDFHQHFVCNYKTECAGREDEMGCYAASCQQAAPPTCAMFINGFLSTVSCVFRRFGPAHALCQMMPLFVVNVTQEETSKGNTWRRSTNQILSNVKNTFRGLFPFPSVSCPDQHRTQDFLAFDAFSACCHDYDIRYGDVIVTTDNDVTPVCVDVNVTSFKALFPCQDSARFVPYSLVCNHIQDCADNSDEDFCVFPPCSSASQYKCANGQCLRFRYHCDEIVQCADESDEANCHTSPGSIKRPRPPVVADFDGRGSMVYTPLTTWSENNAELCPDTHVFCPGDGYCLPVYVRCNGLLDCPGHEDEVGCDSYTCPGLYRCRGLLSICLHPDHLCDGWSQCPQHDDELFCNLTCPVNCTCLGHAFTCNVDFHVELFSGLRYLDARSTGLNPERLKNNLMLVYLSLADCDLSHLGNLSLPNLIVLDLSDNRFSVITISELNFMKNLRNLSLARNPLSTISSGNYSSGFLVHEGILHVDLAGVRLQAMNVPGYLPFPGLLSLNLSRSGVTQLVGNGFGFLKSLRILDFGGCPVKEFPRRVFKDLENLYLVIADNYKLCCQANLPVGFNMDNCHAPFNEISSCGALLRADIYRIFLSVLAALALCGNFGCFLLRTFSLTGRGKTGFNVFVTHLCLSDFLMGLYMAMIGVADRLYLGRYLWEEDRWRHSVACQIAGVLALLSSEVSALTICLITLDRFLVIRFPFSRLRFSSFSAQVASFMIWIVGVVLVTVPLLPVTTYGLFYGQTGICVPLPITRNDFAGHHYAFGVMILFNLVIFIMIATGQISVYLSMTSNAISSIDTSRKSRDLIVARRLITVVVSDFLCWFPLGLLGVLAAQGVPILGEVNVVMAIFVLPLNSALNPFLYTLNMIQEKRQRATEVKLLKMIMDRGMNGNESDKKE